MQLKTIPIESIDIPESDRSIASLGDIDSLAQSIKSEGIFLPIIVTEVNNRYAIVKGWRRLSAARLAGLDSITALVVKGRENIREIYRIISLSQVNPTPIEIATAFKKLLDSGLTHSQIAGITGLGTTLGRSSITRYLRLLDLPEPWQEEAMLRGLGIAKTYALSKLVGKVNDDSALSLIRKVAEQDISVKTLESIISSMLSGTIDKGSIARSQLEEAEAICKAFNLIFEAPVNITVTKEGKFILSITCKDKDVLSNVSMKAMDYYSLAQEAPH